MFIVAVWFNVKPEHVDDFHTAIAENAASSVANEPGCRQFDVCIDPDDRSRVFLYEVYDDDAAFEAHKASAHYQAFSAKAGDWVADKSLHLMSRVAANASNAGHG